ncbi:transcriptional regulator [Robbsia andropogonis]|uniref:Transcriptional regulator n=1 Tax=Robbsia andropogonis TaxID=28092 RepID=A0A0F5JY23_9BURK|nr:nitric oxide reductase transcriptional regulator NorR [Robbsia andropogonis]KKB62738.1 transcriptional regulator [Robbsia andropogonis]
MTLLFKTLLPLITDLTKELSEHDRFSRLLDALYALLPCDAIALLRREGETLTPVATRGLSPDTMGRHFPLDQHPRLRTLIDFEGPYRFAPDSALPDPYDGLIDSGVGLAVHDCVGCRLSIDGGGTVWGVLTLDALNAGRFDAADLETLAAFAALAAATVLVNERIATLAQRVVDEQQAAQLYRQAALAQRRPGMLGQSRAFHALLEEIDTVAPSDLTVLITGETGTGKERVAEMLHGRSLRQGKPLVSLNCAALPESLVESELFGHVRGAFSGAQHDRRGKFDLADGGTLFLDEVGELPLSIQGKLLRVLQGGQLQRLGSDREHRVDVRVLAATNRNLAIEVRAGRFRADLFHRLAVYALHVPALRERGHDALLLAGYFLEDNRSRLGLRSIRLSRAAQQIILRHDWPGNVRELEHMIGRAALKSLSRATRHAVARPSMLVIDVSELDIDGRAGDVASEDNRSPQQALPDDCVDAFTNNQIAAGMSLREATDAFQKRAVLTALARHDQQWADAARTLGIDRANLNRLAKRLQLK